MNFLDKLSDYMSDVFDANGDGKIDYKEVLHRISHFAPALAMIVVDLLVLVAEFRVWDMGMTMTKNEYKAVGFVLVSALPFYLGQVLWIYPRGSGIQKTIAVAVMIGGLFSSAMFGRADLFLGYDLNFDATYLLSAVVNLTIAYIVVLIVYVVIDPGIKAWRMKIKAKASAQQQADFLQITRGIMEEMRKTQLAQKELEKEFDDPEAVRDTLARLRGEKPKKEEKQKEEKQKEEKQPVRPIEFRPAPMQAEAEKVESSPTNGGGK